MVINKQLVIIIIIITIQPRSVLGSFDVVLSLAKLIFKYDQFCRIQCVLRPLPPPPGSLSLNFGHMWGAKTCMYVQLI